MAAGRSPAGWHSHGAWPRPAGSRRGSGSRGGRPAAPRRSGDRLGRRRQPQADARPRRRAPTVPLRESFSFDAHYAQCIIEDNPAAFAMDTYEMGEVVVEAHTFFMAMYANEMSLVSIRRPATARGWPS